MNPVHVQDGVAFSIDDDGTQMGSGSPGDPGQECLLRASKKPPSMRRRSGYEIAYISSGETTPPRRHTGEIAGIVALFLVAIAACLLWPPADARAATVVSSLAMIVGVVGLSSDRRYPRSRRTRKVSLLLASPVALVAGLAVLGGSYLQPLMAARRVMAVKGEAMTVATDWCPNLGPVPCGDLRMRVASATFENDHHGRFLTVAVEVSNGSDVHKLDNSLADCRWSLADEHGNDYRLRPNLPSPSKEERSLYPGDSYMIHVTFQAPVQLAKELTLRIQPGGQFSHDERPDIASFQIATPSILDPDRSERPTLLDASEHPQP